MTTADRRPDRPGGRGLVIAEGVVVVERLFASRYPVRALLGVERRLTELERLTVPPAPVPFYVATADVMARVVGFHLNRGVLATADRPEPPELERLLATSGSLAVLEGIGDHENLGALFRNAAALGVDAVILGPGCADPLYRRAVRVSMGNVFRVPFLTAAGSITDLLDRIRAAGFVVAALTPGPEAVPLPQVKPAGPRLAVLLGSEGPGLSTEALTAADLAVRIPMSAGVDSLNVATAAAVAFAGLLDPQRSPAQ